MKTIMAIVCLFGPLVLNAQESRFRHAEKCYENGFYFDAASAFEDALARGTDSTLVADKIADCYYRERNYSKALDWHLFMLKRNSLSKSQLVRCIHLQLFSGNYRDAVVLAKRYDNEYHDLEWCKNLIREAALFEKKVTNDNYILTHGVYNSGYADFGVNYTGATHVMLTSNRFALGKAVYREDAVTGEGQLDLILADLNNNGELTGFKKVSGVPDTYNEGPACLDAKHQWLYFTSDNYETKTKLLPNELRRLKIYRGKWNGESISQIESLHINSDTFSCAHPSITPDGTMLYFSSDRPGGFGGSDLYRVSVSENGQLGEVENLGGKINTPGNEYFPNIHSVAPLLFFSSDGHIGFGGLDNFYSKLDHFGHVKSIDNFGYGINTPQDDFAFVVNENQTKGYVSSNRNGGDGGDDIYQFVQRTPIKTQSEVRGTITSLNDNAPIPNSLVVLKNGGGEIIDSARTDSEGNYMISSDKFTEGDQIVINEDGFFPVNQPLQDGEEANTQIQNIVLRQDLGYVVNGLVLDSDTEKPNNGVKVTVTDLLTGQKYYCTTDDAGNFNSPLLEQFHTGDVAKIEVKFEKKGYVTVTYSLEELLGSDNELTVNGNQPVQLKKIISGKTDLNEVIAINPIYFDYRKWQIRPDAAVELDKVVKIMKDNPEMVIELGAHTDTRGNETDNQRLSQHRAEASVAYIRSKGIANNRIKAKGYGESKPKISDTEINAKTKWDEKEKLHQLNRRTEFIILKN